MMNRVEMNKEMNDEMLAQVNGGAKYNVGDHVEVKTYIGTTCGGTIKSIATHAVTGERIYYVDITKWYDLLSDEYYSASEFE